MSSGADTASGRRRPWSVTTLGPLALPDGVLALRSPMLGDGPAWSRARLANREWLERAFPAWGDDWAAEQSEVAWAQRWAHLRRMSASGRAIPFVLTLDGELIGEVSIDAVDEVSNTGEASVWMVRSHGSSSVMNALSLLMIRHCFSGPHALTRMLSPVATTSRNGRSPGLRAVGFDIEATLPRRAGAGGLVDHDMWVLPNTAAVRRTIDGALRAYDTGPSAAPPEGRRGIGTTTAQAAGRAAVRGVRAGLRDAVARARDRVSSSRGDPGPTRPTTRRDRDELGAVGRLPRHAAARTTESGGRPAVVVARATDIGTATTEVFAVVRPGTPSPVVAAAVSEVVDEARPGAGEARLALVRVPVGAPAGTSVDAGLLEELGLERVAVYRAVSDGARHWGGEEVWRIPPST